MIHFFKKSVSHLALPEKFTYPFHYTPHPLCVLAAEEVKKYIASRKEWQEELASGKMFGVLIVNNKQRRKSDWLSCSFLRQSGRKESASLFRSSCL